MEAEPLWSEKFKGFRNVRGTAVIRVQINAQPFHAGRLLLHFLPLKAQIDFVGTPYASSHNYNLMTKTQQPCVEIDCRDTSGILKVPYCAPSQYYDVHDNVFDWGQVYLTVLAPLKSEGAPTVDLSIWMSFEDFEVAAPYYPLSSKEPRLKSRAKRFTTDDPESELCEGPISSKLALVSKVAETAAGVPLISEFAKPVAWAASASAKLASYFGYSKPISEQSASYYIPRPHRLMANSEGAMCCEALAMTVRPEVQVRGGYGGTNEDEMSYEYIKGIPAYGKTLNWLNTHTANHLIWGGHVGPRRDPCRITKVDTVGGVGQHTATFSPFANVSIMHEMWRGSIEITLKVIKTQYHSGRLVLCFNPGPQVASGPDNNESQYVYRHILDIREGSEVTVRLPYLLNVPYNRNDKTFGYFSIRVLNELRGPTTVANNVDILVYTNAGPDFEVAVPYNRTYIPYTPQSGGDATGVVDNALLASSGIGGSTETASNMQSANCIGDYSSSLKQFGSRFSRIYTIESQSDLSVITDYRIYPFFMGFMASATTGPVLKGGTLFRDMQSFIMSAYAMSRGSMNYLYEAGSANVAVRASLFPTYTGTDAIPQADSLVTSSVISDVDSSVVSGIPSFDSTSNMAPSNSIVAYPRIEQGVMFTCPQYEISPTRLNIPTFTQNQYTTADWRVYPKTAVQLNVSANPNYARLYRAFGDDFSCHYFVGFPPLLTDVS